MPPSSAVRFTDEIEPAPFYALCNILSDPDPVERTVLGVACCMCAQAVFPQPQQEQKDAGGGGGSVQKMDPAAYAAMCFTGDTSQSLDSIVRFCSTGGRLSGVSLGRDEVRTYTLWFERHPPTLANSNSPIFRGQAMLVSIVRDGLWSLKRRSMVATARLILSLPHSREWEKIAQYMGSAPIVSFHHHYIFGPPVCTDDTTTGMHCLPGSIHGVATPDAIYHLLCSSSRLPPGVAVPPSSRRRDTVYDGTHSDGNVFSLEDLVAEDLVVVRSGIFQSALSGSGSCADWVEGAGLVACKCYECARCALGCRRLDPSFSYFVCVCRLSEPIAHRRSVLAVHRLAYCTLPSPMMSGGARPSIGWVPLDRMLWRVSWKAHAVRPKRQAVSSTSIAISDVVLDAGVSYGAEPGSYPPSVAVLKLADSWVHLDVCESTVKGIAVFAKHLHPTRGDFSGYHGFAVPPTDERRSSSPGDLHCVVLGTLPGGDYEVLVQVCENFFFLTG